MRSSYKEFSQLVTNGVGQPMVSGVIAGLAGSPEFYQKIGWVSYGKKASKQDPPLFAFSHVLSLETLTKTND